MKESATSQKSISLGFTGTQSGMSPKQKSRFVEIMESLKTQPTDFHHGDCIGSDREAHSLVLLTYPEITIHIHPPRLKKKRAFSDMHHKPQNLIVYEPEEYLTRNHIIVDHSDILIATPKEHNMVLRSGTWATVRYANKQGKIVIIINPDGTMENFSIFSNKVKKVLEDLF